MPLVVYSCCDSPARFLVREDLRGLFHFARELDYPVRPAGYLSRYHICVDIRRYLAAKEGFPELTPARFYEELTAED